MIAPDDILDRLLLALTRAPRDAGLIAIIADRLEETDHPAGQWWREYTYDLCRHPRTGVLLGGLIVRWPSRGYDDALSGGYRIDRGAETLGWPGIADLCQRLDRVTAVASADYLADAARRGIDPLHARILDLIRPR